MALWLDGGAAAVTAQGDNALSIGSQELQVGLAKRPCPYCAAPLLIRLPSMENAIADQRDSQALKLGIDNLTPTERLLFDTVYSVWPRAVSIPSVLASMDNITPNNLGVVRYNLRVKLKPYGWVLITYHGSLRLVEPVPIV